MKIATKLKEYIDEGKLVEFGVLDSLRLTSKNSLRVTLARLVKQGDIYSPLKGIYVSKTADPFWVAAAIFPGYISLTSALYLHHLTDEYPFTIFVGSERRKRLKLGNHELHYFRAKNYKGLERNQYQVASVEKVIYDSLLHPELAGYPRIAKALHSAPISARKFILLCKNEQSAFFQRLGYLLSILPNRDKEKEALLKYCEKRVKANAYLQGRKPGRYVPEWKIIDNVGKEVLLSWWEQ
jgi:predicted transcriptional regulator of viral defense system